MFEISFSDIVSFKCKRIEYAVNRMLLYYGNMQASECSISKSSVNIWYFENVCPSS